MAENKDYKKLLKKVDKSLICRDEFLYLVNLFESSKRECTGALEKWFGKTSSNLRDSFERHDFQLLMRWWEDGRTTHILRRKRYRFWRNIKRLLNRFVNPTGMVVVFIGSNNKRRDILKECIFQSCLPFRIKKKCFLGSFQDDFKRDGQWRLFSKLVCSVISYFYKWMFCIYPLKVRSGLIFLGEEYENFRKLVDCNKIGVFNKVARFIFYRLPKVDLIVYEGKSSKALERDTNFLHYDKCPLLILDEFLKIISDRMAINYKKRKEI